MNVLHLQLTGNPGGVVVLCRDIANNSANTNYMYFMLKGGIIADDMEKDGTPVVVAAADRFRWKKSKKDLIDFCRKNEIDVIVSHANAPMVISHALAVKRELPKTKIVMYLHSAAENGLGKGKRRIIIWPFIYMLRKRADLIVAISEFVKNSYMEAWGKKYPIEVVYNGVDSNKILTHENNYESESMELIYTGRLFDAKGINLLIEAIGMLDATIPVHLSIVGDGPGREKYEQMAKDLGVYSKVDFWGSRNDVPIFLSKAHFFVHPAICNEGFGITLAEALMAGVPCVAFRKGAIPELIEDRVNGYIVDEITPSALSKKIEECYGLFRDTKNYKTMVENAKRSAYRFEICKVVDRLEGLMNDL